MIRVDDLTKHFGGQTLFEGVNLQLIPPNRYGVVGANGSGKSTFLRILTGQEQASGGEVAVPKKARVGVLEQDRFESLEQRVLDVAMMGDEELWSALKERNALLAEAEKGDFDTERYGELEDLVAGRGGYTLEARAAEILEGLGIPAAMHDGPLRALSGGFQLRAILAQTLAAQPDVLLLDEPTNHLDIVSIRWLEQFLLTFPGLVVVVSHDHRFLEDVCTHILDVDYGVITQYVGAYEAFEAQKEEARARQEKAIAKREKEIADARAFIDRFKAKASKARQAQSRVKQLEKTEAELIPLQPSSRRYPHFAFSQVRPSGREVLEVKGLSKSYGSARVLEDVSFSVRRGERIAMVGANGVGKSTLLKALVGEVPVDEGTIRWGHEIYQGYFPQDHKDALGESGTALSWLWDQVPAETVGVVRGNLGRVLFEGDDVDKRVTDLSGGEAARLLFCRLMIEKPNLLILDEPTNHLDLESIEALAAALSDYEGTLLFVSHDRWFVSALATRIVELKPGEVNDFPGTWDEYLERQGTDHLDKDAVLAAQRASTDRPKSAPKDPAAHRQRNKAAAREKKKLEDERDQLVHRLEAAEAEKEALDARFCQPGFYEQTAPDEVQRLQTEQARLEGELGELMTRWEQVESLLESYE